MRYSCVTVVDATLHTCTCICVHIPVAQGLALIYCFSLSSFILSVKAGLNGYKTKFHGLFY